MLKFWLFILGSVLLVSFLLIGISNKVSSGVETAVSSKMQDDGRQLVEILAKGGYSPNVISSRAGVETVLRVESRGTFDCSSSLIIPQLRIRKNLPPTGVTDIVIPAQQAGTQINGTCAMGMYNFVIKYL